MRMYFTKVKKVEITSTGAYNEMYVAVGTVHRAAKVHCSNCMVLKKECSLTRNAMYQNGVKKREKNKNLEKEMV